MSVNVEVWAEHRFGLAEIQAMPALMMQHCPGRTWEWGLRPTDESFGSFGARLDGQPNMITFWPGTLRIWDLAKWLVFMESNYWRATVHRRVLAIARALDLRELIWLPDDRGIEYDDGGQPRSYAQLKEALRAQGGRPQPRIERLDPRLAKATTVEQYRAWYVETLPWHRGNRSVRVGADQGLPGVGRARLSRPAPAPTRHAGSTGRKSLAKDALRAAAADADRPAMQRGPACRIHGARILFDRATEMEMARLIGEHEGMTREAAEALVMECGALSRSAWDTSVDATGRLAEGVEEDLVVAICRSGTDEQALQDKFVGGAKRFGRAGGAVFIQVAGHQGALEAARGAAQAMRASETEDRYRNIRLMVCTSRGHFVFDGDIFSLLEG